MHKHKPENTDEIERLRREIDVLDAKIVEIIASRAELAQKVGHAKGGTPVYRPERERAIIERARVLNRERGSLVCDESIETICREVIAACRAVEGRPRVAYLGPQGTFTEMAAIAQFGTNFEATAAPSIDETFRLAESDTVDFAVVPAENSTQGTITRTMDLLLTTPLSVIAEVNVAVCHNLMNKSGKIEDIQKVAAHPQALGQCHGWLSSHIPAVEQVSASSNAEAARLASLDPSLAAIAAERAADLYGLTVVEDGIQDDPRNRTRFLILGHHPVAFAQGVRCKTSIVFSVPNRAGALMKALVPFEKHGVSMTRLESRPARNGAWDYNFFIDCEGHRDEEAVKAALAEVQEGAGYFKILGSYPEAKN